jgi:hypothetical protein
VITEEELRQALIKLVFEKQGLEARIEAQEQEALEMDAHYREVGSRWSREREHLKTQLKDARASD